jgi:phenylalanyl-tRNA synthetase beta chain
MKVTWNWLSEWVDLPAAPEDLVHLLAMRGFPVQSVERGRALDPAIVVGHVLEAARHPNADRLSLCKVDIASEPLSIVCGAPNVAAGQRVAVAQVGAVLPDGTRLRRSKIRGVESQGMICSERELGLSEQSEGIWVIPGAPPIGTPVASLLGPQDAILDVEITSNRTDCMSVVGLAREIASARGGALKPARPVRAEGSAPLPDVAIEDPADCPRYMVRVVRGIRVGPSPAWLRGRLEASGLRSINNVVDATNYVLREFGQPIHAFDAAKVGGNAIRVRRARKGESLRLLDGRDVALQTTHLVIADDTIPMALAGVMGGLDSGITEATTTVTLESAQFNAALTRETARSLGIVSEAAERFAQGVDPSGVADALDATARILAEVAAGEVSSARVDRWPGRADHPPIALSHRRLSSLLGLPVDEGGATRSLQTLGIEMTSPWARRDGDSIAQFRAPSYRLDLEIEEDLIEEVGRVIGYDAIPGRVRAAASPPLRKAPEEQLVTRWIDVACGLGFHEAVTGSLVGEIPAEAREGIAPDAVWELQNPLSRELKHLRVGLLPGLIQSAARNLHHGVTDVRLAEVGKVFQATPSPLGTERYEAAMLLAGAADDWNRPGADTDRFLEIKGAAEAMLEALGIDSYDTRPYHHSCWKRGTGAEFAVPERRLGHFGEIAPSLAAALGLDRPAWAAVFDLAALAERTAGGRRYRAIPRYPASKRDIAVIVPTNVAHASLVKVLREAGGAILTQARLFDVFQGGAIGAGQKSMAYALEFRAPDRTLEDREVDATMASIVRAVSAAFGAVVRGEPARSGSEE